MSGTTPKIKKGIKGIKHIAARVTAIALIAVMGAGWGAFAASDETNAAIGAKRGEREGVQSELESVRGQIEDDEGKNERLRGDKSQLDAATAIREMEYDDLLELLFEYREMIRLSDLAIQDAERVRDEQLELLKARVRAMYMTPDYSYLEAILSARSITDMMEKTELFSVIADHDRELLVNYENSLADVEYKRSMQAILAEHTGETADSRLAELDGLNMTRDELEGKILSLQSTIDGLEALEEELEARSAQLEQEINELVAKAEAEAAEAARKKAEAERKAKEEAERKAKAEAERKAAADKAAKEAASGKPAASGGGGGAQTTGGGSGALSWPVPGHKSISSNYGNRIHPIKKTQLFHSGIDIPAPTGADIIAPKSGTVIFSGVQSGYGNTLIIDHGGGLTTLYGHCSKLLVKNGQSVKAGASVAKVGSTGNSTGPHLHFEVRKNGKAVRPQDYM